jgi:hypothetical protein
MGEARSVRVIFAGWAKADHCPESIYEDNCGRSRKNRKNRKGAAIDFADNVKELGWVSQLD